MHVHKYFYSDSGSPGTTATEDIAGALGCKRLITALTQEDLGMWLSTMCSQARVGTSWEAPALEVAVEQKEPLSANPWIFDLSHLRRWPRKSGSVSHIGRPANRSPGWGVGGWSLSSLGTANKAL